MRIHLNLRRCSLFTLLTVSWMAVSGCTVARMAVQQDLLHSVTEMPVEGKKRVGLSETFRFGPYTVDEVHRGWKTTTKFGGLGLTSASTKQKLEFSVASGTQRWHAQCATGVKWKELELGDFLGSGGSLISQLESDTIYLCSFEGADNWKLAMNQGSLEMVMNGVLTDGVTTLTVEGTRALSGGGWPLTEPTGYHFVKAGQPVAAVEVINQGAVWISDSLLESQQNAIANAATALLLYKDLK